MQRRYLADVTVVARIKLRWGIKGLPLGFLHYCSSEATAAYCHSGPAPHRIATYPAGTSLPPIKSNSTPPGGSWEKFWVPVNDTFRISLWLISGFLIFFPSRRAGVDGSAEIPYSFLAC